ncbi:type II toxin-antitoxin system RelB family antitoxin [Desulfuromonas acetexigens]|uniref:Ribbon-helix-helix protein, CopG family n=1 Tax=Trichloromonas acetexigens TaxID=38815 RepID=A0A550J636_9BACT|nr:ribbon-helix-helix protein, CopG family [Desulfuromonas acetexigens]TRO78691.1 ribbon-helix-helix protein, CopG family [Desulfuromonas acetexigens]
MLAVRIPADIENRLEELARKTGRTKTYYVREALTEYLAALEDHYLAEERLRENRPAIPLDEVERTLGLAD